MTHFQVMCRFIPKSLLKAIGLLRLKDLTSFKSTFINLLLQIPTTRLAYSDGPIIIIKVQLKIFEGENETLKCDTVHDKHDWSRGDGERVTNERRVLIAENSKLQITGATILDSGEYVCQHSGRKRYIFTVEIEVIVKVEAVLKVFTYKYTPELQNKSSKIYKQTERNFTATMDKVYNNTPGYNRTEVLGFTNGSVNVDFRIIIVFIATDPKNVSKVTDTKAEAGHKVIVEVQDGLLNDLRVSPDVEVKVPPLEPRSITIFDVEHNELSIKWRPPEDSKNFKVSEYVVQHRKFGVKPPIYKNSTFPASEEKKEYSYRIQNLVPETTYMIQVGARNKFGTNYNDEQPKETLSAPFAKWLIAVIVLAGILVVATIVGVIICLRRKAAERRRNAPEEDEDTRFGSMRLASLSQYEDRYVKGVRYAYTNDFFKTSDVHWKEIPYENITLLNELGSGAFGVVYKGEIIREKGDVTPCAVKSLKASATKEEVRDLYNELEIMTKVGYHPNLVNLLGACTEDGHLLVVLELAENGSLLEFLKKSREVNQNYENINSGGITEELKLRIAIDVARGMSHLASFKCIHRDLAARNVLLGENYVAKVADYGMARDVYEQLMYRKETQGKLPVKWMAIESLETYVFTMESDVWSYGVLLWEIESGGLKPYAGMSTTELIAQLKKGYRLEIPVGCSDAMYQVMRDCWDPNPKARPTFDKLVVRLENMAVAL